jgi:hypothetical protein
VCGFRFVDRGLFQGLCLQSVVVQLILCIIAWICGVAVPLPQEVVIAFDLLFDVRRVVVFIADTTGVWADGS